MDVEQQNNVRALAAAAINVAKRRGLGGADVVKSGLNDALREIGIDPMEATDFLLAEGSFEAVWRAGNMILHHAGEVPQERGPNPRAMELLRDAGIRRP
jgi:hypothetical protein